jgi:hypothetical protein
MAGATAPGRVAHDELDAAAGCGVEISGADE